MANELIEASAGTGKTQALAERLIALLRAGVQPQEIVALTFSRAAAGEIFERFVSLLAARVERQPDDARLLRAVIATQHLSQIGTLDSFLMRIVRSFPLELGLAGELEILDAYQAASAAARVSFGVLRKTDAHVTRAFVEAFALAMNREDVRSFAKSYRAFVAAWHEQVLAHPDAAAWGAAETIWGGAPPFAPATEADLARAADALAALGGHGAKWPAFVQWVRDFRGRFGAPTGFAKKFLEQENVFAGATVAFTFSRKEHVFAGAELAAVRGAFAAVFGYVLRLKLELARGVYALIAAYERAYAQQVRGRGRLVFSDIPRLMAQLGANERLALEYRMDAKAHRRGDAVGRREERLHRRRPQAGDLRLAQRRRRHLPRREGERALPRGRAREDLPLRPRRRRGGEPRLRPRAAEGGLRGLGRARTRERAAGAGRLRAGVRRAGREDGGFRRAGLQRAPGGPAGGARPVRRGARAEQQVRRAPGRPPPAARDEGRRLGRGKRHPRDARAARLSRPGAARRPSR